MMYNELIERLRECTAEQNGEKTLWHQAADAIEELQKQLREEKVDNVNLTGWLAEEHAKAEDFENKLNLWRHDKISRWIPVTERLPPISEEVIVFADRTTIRIWSLERYYPTVADVFWEREDGYHEDADVVSHWMPLPEPPKEDKDGAE